MSEFNLLSRRNVAQSVLVTSLVQLMGLPVVADDTAATVTDKIAIDVKGLGGPSSTETKRIVIGLFGNEAPSSVAKLKQLASTGLPAACRPKEKHQLEREQLEANRVYNSCKESEDEGVSLRYSQIWRVVKDERIDVGSVSGKFIARNYPDWRDDNKLHHDRPGVVSVRRGNDSGFGFTVHPGGNGKDLDDSHIVVGQVLEGMDVVQELNGVPVITSSKVNYMGLTGGPTTKNAPTRGCRYGGAMYCNEQKPLIKLSISDIQLLNR